MQQYLVTGMTCAACSARVEKAVSAVPGVASCAVNLLMNSMGVEGTASPEAVIAAVEAAGYGASLKGADKPAFKYSEKLLADEEALKDLETPKLIRRLTASAAVLAVLMYFSMGHMMWGWPAPAAFDNHAQFLKAKAACDGGTANGTEDIVTRNLVFLAFWIGVGQDIAFNLQNLAGQIENDAFLLHFSHQFLGDFLIDWRRDLRQHFNDGDL